MLGLAAAVVVLTGVYFARELVGPLALAIVLVVICEPVRRPLERRGWPHWTGTTAVILVAYLVLAVMGALLWLAGTQFARLVGEFSDELQDSVQSFLGWLRSAGLDDQAADAAAAVLDPETLVGLASSLGGAVLGVATALFFVVAYVIFMAADASRSSAGFCFCISASVYSKKSLRPYAASGPASRAGMCMRASGLT